LPLPQPGAEDTDRKFYGRCRQTSGQGREPPLRVRIHARGRSETHPASPFPAPRRPTPRSRRYETAPGTCDPLRLRGCPLRRTPRSDSALASASTGPARGRDAFVHAAVFQQRLHLSPAPRRAQEPTLSSSASPRRSGLHSLTPKPWTAIEGVTGGCLLQYSLEPTSQSWLNCSVTQDKPSLTPFELGYS